MAETPHGVCGKLKGAAHPNAEGGNMEASLKPEMGRPPRFVVPSRVQFTTEFDTRRKLEAHARKTGVNLSELIDRIVQAYLEEKK